jgi:hypothetical protein
MAHIQLAEAQSFLEGTKIALNALDPILELEMSNYALGQLAATYDDPTFGVPTWVDSTTTPELVRLAIAMLYAGWYYDRQYSEMVAAEGPSYGLILREQAELLLAGIITSSIMLVELLPNMPATAPVYYPTDVSSTREARAASDKWDDNSVGPAKFSINQVF